MLSSPPASPGDGAATSSVSSRSTGPEGVASVLYTQAYVDALCEEHGVPKKEFTALLAGDLRANSTPPRGCICVYARALEAGMRVPLHPFFLEALAHFGLAPAQLTPNGWRFMACFLALCHSAGVPASLAVFRHFFGLSVLTQKHRKGWYCFRPRDGSCLRFTGMPNPNSISLKDWKREFFFLSSPEPWPCPVDWGEPSKTSLGKPVLNAQETKSAAKLLRLHGGVAVDLRPYLSSSNLAAAMIATSASPPPPPTRTTSCSKGMDPAVHGMMKKMLAEMAAARASSSANKVKAEPVPGGNASGPGSPSLCGEKSGLEEANGEEGPALSVEDMVKTLLAEKAAAQASASAKKRTREEAHGEGEDVRPRSVLNTPPPGFSGKPVYIPSSPRELLQGAVSTPLERALTASEPSEVVKWSHVELVQAANHASFSFRYALELEEKLAAREREAAALREQLEEVEAELAAAVAEQIKARDDAAAAERAGEAEAEIAEGRAEAVKKRAELGALKRVAEAEAEKAGVAAAEAVQQLLASEEQALEGYERWRGRSAPSGRAA